MIKENINQPLAEKINDQEAILQIIEDVGFNPNEFVDLDHHDIALRLIEAGESYSVVSNLDKFSGLDYNDIALKIIEAGEGRLIARNLDKFSGLDHNDIALRLIEAGEGGSVARNLDKFNSCLNQDIALRLIETGNGGSVASNLDKFSNLDYNDIALKLIEAREGSSVADNLDKFSGLDHSDIAIRLIEAGEGGSVASNLDKFTGLDHKDTALKIIEAGNGDSITRNLDKFSGCLNQDIALRLIETGNGGSVASNLDKFTGLGHKDIALRLIEAGNGGSVAYNLDKFSGLDYNDIALQIINAGYGDSVASNLDKFRGLDHKDIALKIIEAGKGDSIARNLDKFSGLNHNDIALRLMEAGEGYSIICNLDKFSGLNHNDIALRLIETDNGGSVARNLDKFSNLDYNDIALKLIEAREGSSVADNLDKFSGLDHNDIAIRLIKAGEGGSVVYNLGKFSGLDYNDIALRLIEAGEGYSFARNLDKISGCLNQDIALRLIEDGQRYSIIGCLDKFHLSSLDFYSGMKNIYPDFFTKLESQLPNLVKYLANSAELLLNLFSYEDNLTKIEQSLKGNPFLIKAIDDNPRYGIRLAMKYYQFDPTAQQEIKELFDAETKIIQDHPDVDKQSLEFRRLMQNHLTEFGNNADILNELTRRGVNVEQWLNYNEQLYFTLGEQEDVKFSDKIKTPIIRVKETLDRYKASITNVLTDYKAELQASFISNPEEAELRQKINELQARMANEPNEQKKQGMNQGIISLQTKIDKLKPVNAWSRIQSDIFRLRSMMDNIFKFYDLCAENEANLENIKDRASLIKEKDQLQKNIAQLKVNFIEFEAFFDTYQAKLAELIAPILGQDRADALLQESVEVVGEELHHYNTDKDTLKSIFNDREADNKLKGREMRVAIASRSTQDLYLGNYCPCCICIDSAHHGAESPIADYVTDLGIQNIVVYDEKKNVPVVVCWTFIGENSPTGEPIMVIDNIEANTEYSVDYGQQISDNIARFVNNYAQSSGIQTIIQGPHNNDLEVFPLQKVQNKLGELYNREGGYYLEAENKDYD